MLNKVKAFLMKNYLYLIGIGAGTIAFIIVGTIIFAGASEHNPANVHDTKIINVGGRSVVDFCLEGVRYIYMDDFQSGGMAVKRDVDGNVVRCGELYQK